MTTDTIKCLKTVQIPMRVPLQDALKQASDYAVSQGITLEGFEGWRHDISSAEMVFLSDGPNSGMNWVFVQVPEGKESSEDTGTVITIIPMLSE